MGKLFAVVMQNDEETMLFVEGETEDDVRRIVVDQTSINFDIVGEIGSDRDQNRLFKVDKDLIEKLIG